MRELPNEQGDAPNVDALIERLVRDARLPSARARDELRRELASHFADAIEEAGATPEAIRAVVERFGSTSDVAHGLRRAHRPGRIAWYVARVIVTVLVSAIVAALVQTIANLRIAPGFAAVWVTRWYFTAAHLSFAVVIVAVAACELGIEPLCIRLDRRPVHLMTMYAVFLLAMFVTHTALDQLVDPLQAIVATGAMIAVWTSTIAIVARFERVFVRLFGTEV